MPFFFQLKEKKRRTKSVFHASRNLLQRRIMLAALRCYRSTTCRIPVHVRTASTCMLRWSASKTQCTLREILITRVHDSLVRRNLTLYRNCFCRIYIYSPVSRRHIVSNMQTLSYSESYFLTPAALSYARKSAAINAATAIGVQGEGLG